MCSCEICELSKNAQHPNVSLFRGSRLELFCNKGALKICSKFTGEHPCSHFGMGVLLLICCIFSEQLFLRTLWMAAFDYSTILHFKFSKMCPKNSVFIKF